MAVEGHAGPVRMLGKPLTDRPAHAALAAGVEAGREGAGVVQQHEGADGQARRPQVELAQRVGVGVRGVDEQQLRRTAQHTLAPLDRGERRRVGLLHRHDRRQPCGVDPPPREGRRRVVDVDGHEPGAGRARRAQREADQQRRVAVVVAELDDAADAVGPDEAGHERHRGHVDLGDALDAPGLGVPALHDGPLVGAQPCVQGRDVVRRRELVPPEAVVRVGAEARRAAGVGRGRDVAASRAWRRCRTRPLARASGRATPISPAGRRRRPRSPAAISSRARVEVGAAVDREQRRAPGRRPGARRRTAPVGGVAAHDLLVRRHRRARRTRARASRRGRRRSRGRRRAGGRRPAACARRSRPARRRPPRARCGPWPPCRTLSYSHMSPAASDALAPSVRRRLSQRTPPSSPICRPARRASITSGTAPTPHTTAPARPAPAAAGDHAPPRARRPRSVDHLVAGDDLDPVLLEHRRGRAVRPRRRSGGPAARPPEQDRHALAERGQRRGDLAADVGAADADDVLGAPPRRRARRRRCRARACSGCPRAGRRRPRAGAPSPRWPGARGRRRPPPWSTAWPSARAGSSASTLVRVSSSTSCSRPPALGVHEHAARVLLPRAGSPSWPAGGGRAGRARGRRPATEPSKPSSRSVAAAVAEAMPAADEQDVDAAVGHERRC